MSNIAVIIPTYNARDEIAAELAKIRKVAPLSFIYVVDDSSPDGTADIVTKAIKGDKRSHLLVRSGKGGRGSAVIYGFKQALKDKSVEFFIEMDADLCHDPKYIASLVRVCRNADVVIASKYHPHSTIHGLSFKRYILSRFMNAYARMLLGVPISDYTNGYRCYSRAAVEFITKQRYKSRGFVVLSEIAFRCFRQGFRFEEIPFDFVQVSDHATNLNYREIGEATLTVLKLRFGL